MAEHCLGDSAGCHGGPLGPVGNAVEPPFQFALPVGADPGGMSASVGFDERFGATRLTALISESLFVSYADAQRGGNSLL